MLYERINTLVTRNLAGEATETEIRELQSLTAQNPELEPVVNSIASYWHTQHSSDQEFLEATYLQHLERMKAKGVVFESDESYKELFNNKYKTKRLLKRITLWAIPVILILFITLRTFLPTTAKTKSEALEPNGNNEITTNNGSRTIIQLPDGSRVRLNAGSKLEYDNKSFNNTTREVKLAGEAYFDVVKNASKPFIVNTSSAKVKVLGTTFNVRCYPEDKKIETSLIHGSVEVTLNKRPEEKWVLKPNEKLVLLNEGVSIPEIKEKVVDKKKMVEETAIAIKKPLTYQEGEAVAVEAAWAYDKLSFKDESFAEVANKMARWYDVKFVFRNEELKELLIYGSFAKETIDQAMEALQYSFKFRCVIKDKEVIIY